LNVKSGQHPAKYTLGGGGGKISNDLIGEKISLWKKGKRNKHVNEKKIGRRVSLVVRGPGVLTGLLQRLNAGGERRGFRHSSKRHMEEKTFCDLKPTYGPFL